MQISVDVEGVKQLNAVFEKTETGLKNMREPLRATNTYMRQQIQQNFKDEGSTFNSSWPPLAESTKKQKIKKHGSTTPLVNTGRMKKSFRSSFGPNSLEISNSTQYFKYHQSNKPRTKLPRRVMMAVTNTQQAKIIGFFTKYLNKISNG